MSSFSYSSRHLTLLLLVVVVVLFWITWAGDRPGTEPGNTDGCHASRACRGREAGRDEGRSGGATLSRRAPREPRLPRTRSRPRREAGRDGGRNGGATLCRRARARWRSGLRKPRLARTQRRPQWRRDPFSPSARAKAVRASDPLSPSAGGAQRRTTPLPNAGAKAVRVTRAAPVEDAKLAATKAIRARGRPRRRKQRQRDPLWWVFIFSLYWERAFFTLYFWPILTFILLFCLVYKNKMLGVLFFRFF